MSAVQNTIEDSRRPSQMVYGRRFAQPASLRSCHSLRLMKRRVQCRNGGHLLFGHAQALSSAAGWTGHVDLGVLLMTASWQSRKVQGRGLLFGSQILVANWSSLRCDGRGLSPTDKLARRILAERWILVLWASRRTANLDDFVCRVSPVLSTSGKTTMRPSARPS